MKGIRIITTSLVFALTTIIALTGCTNEDLDQSDFYPVVPDTQLEYVYANSETGKITKAITLGEEVLFNEGYTEKDTEVKYDESAVSNDIFGNSPSIPITSTATIDGKAYPVNSRLNWYLAPLFLDEAIVLYNEHVASPGATEKLFSSPRAINNLLETQMYFAIKEKVASIIPEITFRAKGHTVSFGDDRIISGAAAGTPAWQVLEEITGKTVTTERYYYSYMCASYDVEISNEQAIISSFKQIPGVDKMGHFTIEPYNNSHVIVATDQPCDILPMGAPLPSDGTVTQGKQYVPLAQENTSLNEGTVTPRKDFPIPSPPLP